MGGSSKKTTVGYWYNLLAHYGLSKGPIDAFLELRGGDRTAWKGLLTQSGRINVNKPNLWGGESSEGGLDGDMDIMFGEGDQQANDYLTSQLGADQPTYRGKCTAVWRGGRYGAMNPYPKPLSFKIRRILKGWDNDECWYPEKAEILMLNGNVELLGPGWEYQIESFSEPNTVWNNFTPPTSGWIMGGDMPFSTNGMLGGEYWTPTRSNIWLRRRLRVRTAGMVLHIAADNGCVVWIDGVNIGSSNPSNAPIAANHNNPVSYQFNQAGTVDILVKAFAEISSLDENGNTVTVTFTGSPLIGMNPAHILYDSLTSSDMQAEPVALINDQSFRDAADKLFDEGFGLCTTYEDEDIEEFQQRICNVIGAALTQSRVDGKYYLDLIRGDYVLEDLPIITSDDIIDFTQEPSNLTEAINEIRVEWFDPETKEARTTPPMQSLGAIQAADGVISETHSYPEIPVESLAIKAGMRDLAAGNTPLSRFNLTVNRRFASLRPATYFRLQYPEVGIVDMVCIIGDIEDSAGSKGNIKLIALQDVFSFPDTVFVETESGLATVEDTSPTSPPAVKVVEAPYVELAEILSNADLAAFPDDAGFFMAMASRPSNGLNYNLYTSLDDTSYEAVGRFDWTPSCLAAADASYLDTAIFITGGTDLSLVEVGTWGIWDEEIFRVDAINIEAGVVTLGRGCADTVPATHALGSRLWFCGNWAGSDGKEYVNSEEIWCKAATRTSAEELSLDTAPLVTVEINQRSYRPYPPAGLLINGETYPSEPNGDLIIEWVQRNRVMQSDQLIDSSAAAIGAEDGTTYELEIWDRYTNSLYHSASGVSSPVNVLAASIPDLARLMVWSVRDGLRSWQAATANFTRGEELWEPLHLTVPPKVLLDRRSGITDEAGSVSVWADRSGNGFDATQATASYRPTLTTRVGGSGVALEFDGNNDYLELLGAAKSIFQNTGAGWIFVVERQSITDTSAIERPLVFFTVGGGVGTRLALIHGSTSSGQQNKFTTGGRRLDSNSFQTVPLSDPISEQWTMALAEVDWSNANAKQHINGMLDGENTSFQTPGLTSDTDSLRARIGGNGDSVPSKVYKGQIAAVVIGSGSLPSDEEIDRLFGWAAWDDPEVGLVDLLPVDHPYKDSAPLVD